MNKLICTLISVTIILSALNVFAEEQTLSYTDTVDSKYNTAIETLTEYGVLWGNAGKFNPTGKLTRAEAAKMMILASGMWEKDILATPFSSYYHDVPPEHWAHNYIAAISPMYMWGYDDGNFCPDRNISYEQFVTIAVRMLDYEDYAEDGGGYPLGYRTVALTLDLTRDVVIKEWNDRITREEAAQIIYRTINTPMLVYTGSVEIDRKKYFQREAADGTGKKERTILLDRLIRNKKVQEQSN